MSSAAAASITTAHFCRGLSLVGELEFLSSDERLLSQVQGRTYAYIFGLAERFIGAKVLQISSEHCLGDQVALEALVRMTEEELRHQELFRRLEAMMEADMPSGYVCTANPNEVAAAVLGKSTWAVLALTLNIELFTQAHYRASISPDGRLAELWKDVFLFHWKEESQHARIDELELVREDATLTTEARDAAVNDLIELVGALDGILQAQAVADARYFSDSAGRILSEAQREAIQGTVLKAYRWQYISSRVIEPRFRKMLFSLIDDAGRPHTEWLAPLAYAVPQAAQPPLPMAA